MVTAVDLRLSRAGASGPFEDIALGQPNTGAYDWTVSGPATSAAFFEITVHDGGGHATDDVSDQVWSIVDVSSVGVGAAAVSEFALRAIHPNPTTGNTVIVFDLPRTAAVRLSILDLQGRTVATLVEGTTPAGRHAANWSGLGAGGPVRAGLYFVRYRFPGRAEVKRLLVTR